MMDDPGTSHGDVRHCGDDVSLALVLTTTAIRHLVDPGPVVQPTQVQVKQNVLITKNMFSSINENEEFYGSGNYNNQ